VRFKSKSISYLLCGLLALVALSFAFTVSFAGQSQSDSNAGKKSNGNSKCYVCHRGLKNEQLTTIHLAMDVTCDGCHGPSIEHMHDEMLMTEPDVLFGRAEVNKLCSNPMCHKPGSDRQIYGIQDHKDPAAVKAFLEKWLGRTRPNGRAITHDSVCTDCHGTHNLDKPIDTGSKEQSNEWINLFNRKNLSGWTAKGASWLVKDGQMVATAGTKGEGGDIWTKATFENYLLAITLRAVWPIRAGVWLGGERGPRIEIIDSAKAEKRSFFTGSVLMAGKGLVLVNLRGDLMERESWNTISVRVEDGRVQVWLNGEEIGAVRTGGPVKGKIGLQIERPRRAGASATGQLSVREVLIKRLGKPG